MELLDIVDEQGLPTGETVEREVAHAEGIRHRTSHVWLVRLRGGRLQVLLQKRSADKDSHPGCFDISSAGHIPAGADFVPSALRELREELGAAARPEELHLCGQRSFFDRSVFHGKPFLDRQVSRVYCLWRDLPEDAFALQASEVERVVWMDWEECLRGVETGTFPNCIRPEELQLVRAGALRTCPPG